MSWAVGGEFRYALARSGAIAGDRAGLAAVLAKHLARSEVSSVAVGVLHHAPHSYRRR